MMKAYIYKIDFFRAVPVIDGFAFFSTPGGDQKQKKAPTRFHAWTDPGDLYKLSKREKKKEKEARQTNLFCYSPILSAVMIDY